MTAHSSTGNEGCLAAKAAAFREGTSNRYDEQGDMWFFELWHFLGDVQQALVNAQGVRDCGEADQLRMQVAGTKAGRDFHIDTAAQLLALLTGIIEAEGNFRESMGPNWEGDPLSDAIDAARRFINLEAPALPSTDGAALSTKAQKP